MKKAGVVSALVLTTVLVAPVALLAQDEDAGGTITLEGEVLDLANGVPVKAAIVAIPALGRSDVSDDLGYFRIEDIPTGFYAVRVIRLGYARLDAEVPINGQEVLALYLTPGPLALRGIEVKVIRRDDLDWKTIGTSSRALITPGEMADLRKRYFSLGQVLRTRNLPRARYHPPLRPGEMGCVKLVNRSFSSAREIKMADAPPEVQFVLAKERQPDCAAVVLDGVFLGESKGWAYDMNTQDIYSVRFLYGPEALLRYGHRGAQGVLLIDTHPGR